MQAVHKIQLLLFKHANAGREGFVASLCAEARAVSMASVTVDLATALPAAVMGASTQGGSGGNLPSIEAVLELSAPLDMPYRALAGAVAGIGLRLAGVLDRDLSCVLAGTEHHVMPGSGPVILFCPLRRLPSLSRREFQDYWLNVHAEFGRFPGNRYRQYHCDEAGTAVAASATGLPAGDFDGLAVAYFNDVAHLRATLASPDISKDAFIDEQRFIDHSRSQFRPFTAVDLAAIR